MGGLLSLLESISRTSTTTTTTTRRLASLFALNGLMHDWSKTVMVKSFQFHLIPTQNVSYLPPRLSYYWIVSLPFSVRVSSLSTFLNLLLRCVHQKNQRMFDKSTLNLNQWNSIRSWTDGRTSCLMIFSYFAFARKGIINLQHAVLLCKHNF